MAHLITDIDVGYLSGNSTWHERPEYILVGDRPVTTEEAIKTVDFDTKKVETYIPTADGTYIPSGAFSIVRMLDTGEMRVLAPAVGARYEATPHRYILDSMVENLLALYPDLRICGAGTLSGGATWWIQVVSNEYYIKGDTSATQQRLSYTQTYGQTAHSVFVTSTRIVCDNTRRMAMGEAASKLMLQKHRHTAGAVTKIEANMDLFAELHLGVKKDQELMGILAGIDAGETAVADFLDEMLPVPEEESSTRSKNKIQAARDTVMEIYEGGQHMEKPVDKSKYALLSAYVDYLDHHSYTRSEESRWLDSMTGDRARMKDVATDYLLSGLVEA